VSGGSMWSRYVFSRQVGDGARALPNNDDHNNNKVIYYDHIHR